MGSSHSSTDDPQVIRHDVPSVRDEVDAAQREIIAAVEARRFEATSVFAIRLALEEAVSNALHHGNRNDPTKRVHLVCTIDTERVMLEVADEGEGFDPTAVPDPTAEENLCLPSGRGLMLMNAYMTEVSYNERGNRVTMTFRPTAGEAAEGDRPASED